MNEGNQERTEKELEQINKEIEEELRQLMENGVASDDNVEESIEETPSKKKIFDIIMIVFLLIVIGTNLFMFAWKIFS